MDRISPIFVYAFILTISRSELLPVIFGFFVTEMWPLIDVRICSCSIYLDIPAQSLELGPFTARKHCSGAIVRFSDNYSFEKVLSGIPSECPDQAKYLVRSDLGLICLQRLWTDHTSTESLAIISSRD